VLGLAPIQLLSISNDQKDNDSDLEVKGAESITGSERKAFLLSYPCEAPEARKEVMRIVENG
jgi:hypothetical protein